MIWERRVGFVLYASSACIDVEHWFIQIVNIVKIFCKKTGVFLIRSSVGKKYNCTVLVFLHSFKLIFDSKNIELMLHPLSPLVVTVSANQVQPDEKHVSVDKGKVFLIQFLLCNSKIFHKESLKNTYTADTTSRKSNIKKLEVG